MTTDINDGLSTISVAAARQQVTSGSRRAPTPRLSCERCTQRKVKCDRSVPCSHCLHAGVVCVPVERRRLPRGRSKQTSQTGHDRKGKRRTNALDDVGVRDRLARLEALVTHLLPSSSNQSQIAQDTRPESMATAVLDAPMAIEGTMEGPNSNTPQVAPKIDSAFWNDLFEETRGLRDVLDHASEEWSNDGVDSESPAALTISSSPPPSGSLLLPGLSGSFQSPRSFIARLELEALSGLRTRLYATFFLHVDPVFKIVHRPSLENHLIDGNPYLHYGTDHPVIEALIHAILFAAVVCLDDGQCRLLFNAEKSSIVSKYRQASEAALAQVDFVMTDDLTVLQAFTIFLIATRLCDSSHRVWRLLSLALRIAQSFFLHDKHPSEHLMTVFEREMRRRLWCSISLLDLQAALERTSEPMIAPEWVQSNPPLKLDDDKLSVDAKENPLEDDRFSVMTFTLANHKAQYVARFLCFPPPSGPLLCDWEERQQHVRQLQDELSALFQRSKQDPANLNPFYSYAKQHAECLVVTLQLAALRPILRRQPGGVRSFMPAPGISGAKMLILAVNVLQKTEEMRQDVKSAPWAWFQAILAPWHALAVALAELCVCMDTSLLRSHWPTVRSTYDRLKSEALDESIGVLWRPMEKLMRKVTQKMVENRIMPLSGGLLKRPDESGPLESLTTASFPQLASITPEPLPNGDSTESNLNSSEGDIAGFDNLPLSDDLSSTGMVWPDLDEPGLGFFQVGMDMPMSEMTGHQNSSSWEQWETFVNELQFQDDSIFTFR